MTLNEKIEIMTAFMDGIPIQIKTEGHDWMDWDSVKYYYHLVPGEPRFDWEHEEYRLKPVPKFKVGEQAIFTRSYKGAIQSIEDDGTYTFYSVGNVVGNTVSLQTFEGVKEEELEHKT